MGEHSSKNSSKKRVHVFASGKVQGVYYRDSTKREAKSLGLSGWVRNLSDKRVEALIEGDSQKVDALLSFMREGPKYARVEGLEVEVDEHRGEFDSFEIIASF